MNFKRAQQEMVGFILIVVLVIFALMVFLIISANKPLVSVDSPSTKSLTSSILAYTTDCIFSEPYRTNVMELMIGCYENDKRCVNLNRGSCDYLNETLTKVMSSLADTDPTIVAYKIETYWQSDSDEKPEAFYRLSSGVCAGGTGAKLQGEIEPLDNELKVLLELCTEAESDS